MPRALTAAANSVAVGSMCGSVVPRSAIASMSKNTAPGMWACTNSARGSRLSCGICQVPSSTRRSGSRRWAASQSVVTIVSMRCGEFVMGASAYHRRGRYSRRHERACRSEEPLMSVVRDFEKAFNRRDVEALVACFTPGATYTDMFFGPHTGSAALREMFARMFHEGRDYSWVMDTVVESPTAAAA